LASIDELRCKGDFTIVPGFKENSSEESIIKYRRNHTKSKSSRIPKRTTPSSNTESKYPGKKLRVEKLKARGITTSDPNFLEELKKLTIQEQEETKAIEKEKRKANLINKLTNDKYYKLLHVTIARLFARQLQEDLNNLKTAEKLRSQGNVAEAVKHERRISLAAKWAPNENNFHDRHTSITSSIAQILFPPSPADGVNPEKAAKSLSYALTKYRTEYLVPLRFVQNLLRDYRPLMNCSTELRFTSSRRS
jgi:hypothetical protein